LGKKYGTDDAAVLSKSVQNFLSEVGMVHGSSPIASNTIRYVIKWLRPGNVPDLTCLDACSVHLPVGGISSLHDDLRKLLPSSAASFHPPQSQR
jgi:hypothetical protein